MKIIDLSLPIESDLPSDPPAYRPHVRYVNHDDSVDEMLSFFPGATQEDLPDGKGWAVEFLNLSSHSGTHLDAPYHYFPTMNGGEKSWTIDEVPLEWCFGNGVLVDFTDKPDGYKCSSQDFKDYFEKVGYTLKLGDIVLVNTGAMAKWGTPEYLLSGCGMSKEATLWLVDQGVHVVGTDAWSWDVPLALTAKEFQKNGDGEIIWEGHRAGADKAYCHIEKLNNLGALPLTGFTFYGFPVKIKGASAGWMRAVAMIEE